MTRINLSEQDIVSLEADNLRQLLVNKEEECRAWMGALNTANERGRQEAIKRWRVESRVFHLQAKLGGALFVILLILVSVLYLYLLGARIVVG